MSTANSPYKKIISAIKANPNWNEVLTSLKESGELKALPSKPYRELAELTSLELKKGRVGQATASAILGVYLNQEKFFGEIKRSGCLRPSKLNYEPSKIAALIRNLRTEEQKLSLTDESKEYLSSIFNLSTVAFEASALRTQMLRTLKLHKKTILKSCMVYVDRKFRPSINDYISQAEIDAENYGSPDHVTREQYAEALSLITILLHGLIGLSSEMTHAIDESLILEGKCKDLLNKAVTLIKIKEMETLLDCFPYRARKTAEGVLIEPKEERLEKSIQLGYIQSEQQFRANQISSTKAHKHRTNLKKQAIQLYNAIGDKLIIRKRLPIDRYTMNIPLIPAFAKIIKEEALYQEEITYLEKMAKDEFTELEDLINAETHYEIAVKNLIQTQRIFKIWSTIFFEALDQSSENTNILDMRSRIPVFKKSDLTTLFNEYFTTDQTTSILELLTHDPTQNKYFDIQYTPILKVGQAYVLPMGIFISTDIVRGALYNNDNKRRLISKNKKDPMQKAVEHALKSKGFLVESEVNRKANGQHIEIDILAYREGHLFAIECKNAFHPCSPQELRNSYDHIQKAEIQLDRIKALLVNENTRKDILTQLKWRLDETTKIHTCIVTANRLFNGYQKLTHPVRQAHELLNLLNNGVIEVNQSTYSIWKHESFHISDLLKYLSESSYLNDIFECMTGYVKTIKLPKGSELQIKSFGLDIHGYFAKAEKEYKLLPRSE